MTPSGSGSVGGPPPEWLRLGDPLLDAKRTLGEAAAAQAWDDGRRMSVEDAVAEAVGLGDLAVPSN